MCRLVSFWKTTLTHHLIHVEIATLPCFSDNYLDIGGIEYVMDMDELDENRGRVLRDCQVTSKNVSDNFEAQPLIEVWRQRHFAVENLKAYLDAIASL
ncbi:unnamed protein product [Tilletia controversa]|nr:unnamed protein product [Tilletia controversa]